MPSEYRYCAHSEGVTVPVVVEVAVVTIIYGDISHISRIIIVVVVVVVEVVVVLVVV